MATAAKDKEAGVKMGKGAAKQAYSPLTRAEFLIWSCLADVVRETAC
ncbi:MAG: hypothetical protein ACI9LY_003094 [Arenicella sp.]|jgi:hypothetical protein